MNSAANRMLGSIGLGLLIIVPVYLSLLLLFKALETLQQLLTPVILLLPEWMQHKPTIALLVLVILSLLIGSAVRTGVGRRARDTLEASLLERIPGYSLFRSLTRRLAGDNIDSHWQPALVETDDQALMPVFIIEELPDGRYTVFVPSVPTPLAGAVLVYERERVHPVDIAFTHALRVVSRWGVGAKDMVAAMEHSPQRQSAAEKPQPQTDSERRS